MSNLDIKQTLIYLGEYINGALTIVDERESKGVHRTLTYIKDRISDIYYAHSKENPVNKENYGAIFIKNLDFYGHKKIKNILLSEGIETLGDLEKTSISSLLKTPNMGKLSLKRLRAYLMHEFGIELKDK